MVVMNYFYHFNKLAQDEIACQHFFEKPKGVIEITSFCTKLQNTHSSLFKKSLLNKQN